MSQSGTFRVHVHFWEDLDDDIVETLRESIEEWINEGFDSFDVEVKTIP